MRLRGLIVAGAIGASAFAVWRAELFQVSRPGEAPRPLVSTAPAARAATRFDVTLRAVPVGMRRLASGDGVLLVHYWAPWERHGGPQVTLLDSLRRDSTLAGLGVVVVAFDPFPGVARYVGRRRLRLPVVLDHERALGGALPCPSIPFTYVVDRAGRIAVAQAGEVDWLSPATRATLEGLLAEPPPPGVSPPLTRPSAAPGARGAPGGPGASGARAALTRNARSIERASSRREAWWS